jgi:hypothetical protein
MLIGKSNESQEEEKSIKELAQNKTEQINSYLEKTKN